MDRFCISQDLSVDSVGAVGAVTLLLLMLGVVRRDLLSAWVCTRATVSVHMVLCARACCVAGSLRQSPYVSNAGCYVSSERDCADSLGLQAPDSCR
jgi:hypothetical protein